MSKSGKSVIKIPKFPPNKPFHKWKEEVLLWQCLTDVDKSKHAIVIALSLQGAARNIALDFDPDKMFGNSGLELLLEELEVELNKDNHQYAYDVFIEFSTFTRTKHVSFKRYIERFEKLYRKFTMFSPELADSVLATKLITQSDLSKDQERQVLHETGVLCYERVKAALLRQDKHLNLMEEKLFYNFENTKVSVYLLFSYKFPHINSIKNCFIWC